MPAAPHRGAPCEVHARDGGGVQTGRHHRPGVTHTLDGTPTVRAMPRRLPQGGGQVAGRSTYAHEALGLSALLQK